MSVYATETSAIVALSAYTPGVDAPKPVRKKSREKTMTITCSGSLSDKNIQTGKLFGRPIIRIYAKPIQRLF